ncbi:MAG: 50S ribosomal protein L6 [Burkholderiales bacterium]
MSRIAKYPVTVPANVEVRTSPGEVQVKGPLGSLIRPLSPDVEITREGDKLKVKPKNATKRANVTSGTVRALLAGMVEGVTKGFQKKLTLFGVGYRAQAQGSTLNLTLGYSHPIAHKMPEGIKVETPTQTEIVIKGADKQKVGQVASEVRAYRSPEPYKGKGVRYADEQIVLKETKKK